MKFRNDLGSQFTQNSKGILLSGNKDNTYDDR